MEIRFTKTGNREDDFSCTRKDGSSTWKKADAFFIRHDLAHFAAETILPLKSAFLGMVAAGTNISSFDLPKEQRDFELTHEAIFAEHLVNLLVIDNTQGKINDIAGLICENNQYPIPGYLLALLTDVKIEAIREKYNELVNRWSTLRAGGTLQLFFEE